MGCRVDSEQLRQFVHSHESALLRYAYLVAGSSSEAEDLVQSALTKLLTARARIDSPLAYARKTIFHEVCAAHRRRSRMSMLETKDSTEFETEIATHQWMWSELKKLQPRQRAALVLRYYEGLSDDEIAVALGCRRSTVRSLVARGLKRLKSGMSQPIGSTVAIDNKKLRTDSQ